MSISIYKYKQPRKPDISNFRVILFEYDESGADSSHSVRDIIDQVGWRFIWLNFPDWREEGLGVKVEHRDTQNIIFLEYHPYGVH